MDKKILLVEDEAMIRDMYEMILTKKGYQLETAEDGQTAINKINENPNAYGLILLDIMLPKLDGISVLKKIKESTSPIKDIPVFLLTNLGQENLIKEAMSAGADQYWIKSNIFPMDLVKEIDSFLNKVSDKSNNDSDNSENKPNPVQNTNPTPLQQNDHTKFNPQTDQPTSNQPSTNSNVIPSTDNQKLDNNDNATSN